MSAAAKKKKRKVFCAEPFPTVCFRSQPPPHARADDTADLPSVSHRAISACSTEKATRDARHSLSPAIDQELVPFTLSSSHRPQVATKSGMARLRQAFRATGVRVTCGADPLLALRSRRSFKEIVYPFLSKRSARWLSLFPSGATAVWTIAVASRSDPRMHCVTSSPASRPSPFMGSSKD